MLSRWARRWSAKLFHPLIQGLVRLGITPNMLTAAGLVLAAAAGVLIALNRLGLAALALAISGLLDALDGDLARQRPQPGRLGPFIDSVADHYGDFAVYLGLAWRALAAFDRATVLLVFLAMFGSLVGSHIRSRAGMIGVDLKNTGMFTRMERTLVLLAGLVTGWVIPALVVLAVANNVSAAERVIATLRVKE
jgi:CDP-diacylglycerol---glycerol-3-phosphate 3-phosphatidyltransferase